MKTYRELLERQRRLKEDAPPRTVLHMARKDTGKRERISRVVITAAAAAVIVSFFAICDRCADICSGAAKTHMENRSSLEIRNSTQAPTTTLVREEESIEGAEAAIIEADIYRSDIPLTFDDQIALYNAAQEFNIDYFLMVALIDRETDFRNISGDGGDSIGYTQVQPKWWRGLMEEIGAKDLTVPEDNFRTACAILALLAERYGNIEDVLTAYNSGHPGHSQYATAILNDAERWRYAGSVDNVDNNRDINPTITFREE